MPVHRDSLDATTDAAAPIARAAAAEARAAQRWAAVAQDLLLPDDARLDERTRADALRLLASAVLTQERALRLGAARRLTDWGDEATAVRLAGMTASTLPRLIARGRFADPDLTADLVGRVQLAHLAADLPAGAAAGPERPSLLVRLAECPEPAVAEAASMLLDAANRARSDIVVSDELVARSIWWIAAALADGAPDDPRLALALAEAAGETLTVPAAPDEERAATRLSAAVAARADELPALLLESLSDRQPALFAALLAEALALPFDEVRGVVVDRDGARLTLCLRAAGLDRAAIARIGVTLAGADPRRDLERFADELDEAVALPPADAAAALAPLALPLAFRRARRELGRA